MSCCKPRYSTIPFERRAFHRARLFTHLLSLTDSFALSDATINYASLMSLIETFALSDSLTATVSGARSLIFKSPVREVSFKSPKRAEEG